VTRAAAARAPGKLVILGEYAVLSGAPALAMAVDRHARARIGPGMPGRWSLETRQATRERLAGPLGTPTGLPIVDTLAPAASPSGADQSYEAVLDSAQFFAGPTKLGLGSSAAALCAWAGASTAYRCGRDAADALDPVALVAAHRVIQRGLGSGIDVAASFTGGVIRYSLGAGHVPQIGSVQLPNGVAFAGIFVGTSASTPDLVSRYQQWESADGRAPRQTVATLTAIATIGCDAASEGDARGFLDAVEQYGEALGMLGRAMDADILTREHRLVAGVARRFGVVYKTSGAGGGDLGLALSAQSDAVDAFGAAVQDMGFQVLKLAIDQRGLVIEELVE
jgi:phosphomevalonate kinase